MTNSGRRMRVGLAGTGPWARTVHGPGLLGAEAVELVGVWGRSAERSRDLADVLGVPAYPEYDALLADVDAVAFALPPDVQVGLAGRAVEAGRHLLLEKPVATDPDAARRLAEQAKAHGVASVVFFIDRFLTDRAAWIEEVQTSDGWRGAAMRWLAALGVPDDPDPASPWRHEKGALWDVGPHAVSTLTAVLGAVEDITAVAGQHDLVHLVLRHSSGATSTATLTLFAPPAAAAVEVLVWGDPGTRWMPERSDDDASRALGRAATALVESAATGVADPAALALGVRVTELLAEAERQLGR